MPRGPDRVSPIVRAWLAYRTGLGAGSLGKWVQHGWRRVGMAEIMMIERLDLSVMHSRC